MFHTEHSCNNLELLQKTNTLVSCETDSSMQYLNKYPCGYLTNIKSTEYNQHTPTHTRQFEGDYLGPINIKTTLTHLLLQQQ